MTEAEWLTSRDSAVMLAWLRAVGRASERKLFLFACACQRRIWHTLEDDGGGRTAVRLLEPLADGLIGRTELPESWKNSTGGSTAAILSRDAALSSARLGLAVAGEELAAQADLLRDIFGNPFRPAADLASFALTSSVLTLAQATYENRQVPSGHLDPVRLAQLAAALEVAGCTETEMLGHLRSSGPHVRGCFAVDRILGKT